MRSSPNKVKYIYIISDGSGFTGERVLQASLVQFEQKEVVVERIPNVKTTDQIREIVKKAKKKMGFIAYTLVTESLRREIATLTNEYSVPVVDLLGSLLTSLANF